MPFRHRTTGHLNDTCLSASVQFAPCGTGIGADVVADNIRYAILNIKLNDICYGSGTDCIAMGNLAWVSPVPWTSSSSRSILISLVLKLSTAILVDY